ncbi:hypothetical protein [Neobacillus cucumis]|uniref:hypothetical protein n=1 Tax=Neobacillus cucumis TaxID=1740721 RepID=UPI001963911E|nr:hypothetical protein [Neobacillus cucumis]MBM7655869.1 hypothetical protein [Neobacillus cucumis]
MGNTDSNSYLSLKDSALFVLNFLDINPNIDNNLDKMYRRIIRLMNRSEIPFKKVNQRYFLNTTDIVLLGIKIKEELKISNSYVEKQTPEYKTTSSIHFQTEQPIEKIENIIQLHKDKTISAKHALIIINSIIKNYKKA